mgnify:CR=1 FL=1
MGNSGPPLGIRGGGEVGRWGDGELGAPTTDREWGLGAVGRWGEKFLSCLPCPRCTRCPPCLPCLPCLPCPPIPSS